MAEHERDTAPAGEQTPEQVPSAPPPGTVADVPNAPALQAPEPTRAGPRVEPADESVAIYYLTTDERGNELWTLARSYKTQEGAFRAFTTREHPSEAVAGRLVSRTDGEPWPDTLYTGEIMALNHHGEMRA